jgi:hypothetical protein
MEKDCLAGHQGPLTHDDWWWPLSYVPRAWTSFCLGRFAWPPSYRWGNLEAGVPGHFKLYQAGENKKVWYPDDHPPAGCWWLGWPPYWAWTRRTRDALQHWRLGFRYTTTTSGAPAWEPTPRHNYYNFPAGPAIREISPDLARALSRQQLRNHLLHGAVAVALTGLLLYLPLPRWAVALLAVATVALGKEYVEVMRRIRRLMLVHWWDGVLDAAGWLFFSVLTILVWRWLT